jgi:hypothetical protein
MNIIIGMVFGSIEALFFTALGMAIQKKIDGTEDEDE